MPTAKHAVFAAMSEQLARYGANQAQTRSVRKPPVRKGKYTAFGVNAPLLKLMKQFNCPVHETSVYLRMNAGMSLEEALSTPRRQFKKGETPPAFWPWIIKWRKIHRHAWVIPAIEQRLTSTMLQYRVPEFAITVTRFVPPRINVEIRDDAGTVLHRLFFVQSYSSGVLFLFHLEKHGAIDFIAFEPDCPHLLDERSQRKRNAPARRQPMAFIRASKPACGKQRSRGAS